MAYVATGMRNEPGNPVGTKVQLIIFGKLRRERARWIQSRDVIGYPSGRDGAIQACTLGTTRCIPQEKFPRKPYKKSFIDQVCWVKMAGYWPLFIYLFVFVFASLWTSTSSRSINKQIKNLANIQLFWPHTWSITHMHWNKCFLQNVRVSGRRTKYLIQQARVE